MSVGEKIAGRRGRLWRVLALPLALALLLAACGNGDDEPADDDLGADAQADDDDADDAEADPSYLDGETFTFTIPFDPGGGNDAYVRTAVEMLDERWENTDVIAENEPGAGGLVALNRLASAEPDGLEMLLIPGLGIVSAALADAEGVAFDVGELSWVGRFAGEPQVLVVGADSEFESFEDVLEADNFRFGGLGPGSASAVNEAVLSGVFDANFEVISGFEGSGEVDLSIAQGDIDGTTGTLDSVIGAIESGEQRALLVMANEPADELPDVPISLEFAEGETEEQMIQSHNALINLGRAVVTTPGVPSERLEALRDEFEAILTDPDNIEEYEEQGRPVDHLRGDVLQDDIAGILDGPPEFRDLMVNAYE